VQGKHIKSERAATLSNLLVIGAREHSLGDAIACEARVEGFDVVTAGIEEEDEHCDITVWQDRAALKLHRFDNVVCTVGVNLESEPGSLSFARSLSNQIATNAIAPLTLLDEWYSIQFLNGDGTFNFVAISSNSARIPRSNSVGYCASKAALSMGIQSFGRSIANDMRFAVWCYEPAWIPDTPMSKELHERINPLRERKKNPLMRLKPEHRVPGGRLMTAEDWATRIIHDIRFSGETLNGCAIRLDAEL
jgi:NAD(P)-dependent dehydrogenase (short-subunit alcohol dehydrogenase family)